MYRAINVTAWYHHVHPPPPPQLLLPGTAQAQVQKYVATLASGGGLNGASFDYSVHCTAPQPGKGGGNGKGKKLGTKSGKKAGKAGRMYGVLSTLTERHGTYATVHVLHA